MRATTISTVVEEDKPMLDRMAGIQIGQVTTGINPCAAVLQTRPEDVMLCILPTDSNNNISIRIEQKLIEAFCLEADIEVVRVGCLELITAAFPHAFVNKTLGDVDDEERGCIIVCYPQKSDEASVG